MSEKTAGSRPPRWLKPMNKVMMAVQRLGIPTGPAMVLTVPGRKSGVPRSTRMTPFDHDGGLYAVAGYPGSDWAANARAAGPGTIRAESRPGAMPNRTAALRRSVVCQNVGSASTISARSRGASRGQHRGGAT